MDTVLTRPSVFKEPYISKGMRGEGEGRESIGRDGAQGRDSGGEGGSSSFWPIKIKELVLNELGVSETWNSVTSLSLVVLLITSHLLRHRIFSAVLLIIGLRLCFFTNHLSYGLK